MVRHIRQRNSGFTLIELLVVVAVIAALAAMLFPLLVQARDSAKMKHCMSNLRMLSSAFRQYTDDYDGYALPLTPNNYPSQWVVYTKPLASYVGQHPAVTAGSAGTGSGQIKQRVASDPRRVWVCPGDRDRGSQKAMYSFAGSSYMYPAPGSYVTIPESLHPWDFYRLPQSIGRPRRIDQWARPQRDMMFGDFWNYYHRGLAPSNDRNGHISGDPSSAVRSVNLVMLDMHATTVAGEDVVSPDGKFGKYLLFVFYYDNRFSNFPKGFDREGR